MKVNAVKKVFYIFAMAALLVVLSFVSGCGEDSSEALGGDYDTGDAELADRAGDDRCADVGDEACPAATDCMIFTAIQTAFPECAIYCRVDVINEGITCRVLEEFGVCSNGRCVIPGQTVDGDADNAACRPEYAEVPECLEDMDCASYEHMWRPSPDCKWLCVALPRDNGMDCVIGDFIGICDNAQCVPFDNGDGESLPDGDIDDIEDEIETELQDGESGDYEDAEFEEVSEEDSAAGDIDDELSETTVDGDDPGGGGGAGGETETFLTEEQN